MDFTSAYQKAMTGDQEGFRFLYDSTAQPVYEFLLTKLGDQPKADQLIGKVYEQAWANLGNLANPEEFPGWVYSIAQNMVTQEKGSLPVPPIGAHLPNGNVNVGNLHDAAPGISPNVANVKNAGSPNLAGGGSPNEAHVSALRNIRADGGASPNVAHQAGGGQADPLHALNQAGGNGPKTGAGRVAGKTGGSAAKKAGGTFFKTAAGKATIAVTTATVLTTAGLVTYNVVKDDEKEQAEATTVSAIIADTEDGSGNLPTEDESVNVTTEEGLNTSTESSTESKTETANTNPIGPYDGFAQGKDVYLLQHETITVGGKTYEFDYSYDPDQKKLTVKNVPDDMNDYAFQNLSYSAPVSINEILDPYDGDRFQPALLPYVSGNIESENKDVVENLGMPRGVMFSDTNKGYFVYSNCFPGVVGIDMMETYDESGRIKDVALDTADPDHLIDGLPYSVQTCSGYTAEGRLDYSIGVFAETYFSGEKKPHSEYAGKRFTYDVNGNTITANIHGIHTPFERTEWDAAPYRYSVKLPDGVGDARLVDSDDYSGKYTFELGENGISSVQGTLTSINQVDGTDTTETFSMSFSYKDGGLVVDEEKQISGTIWDGESESTGNESIHCVREYILLKASSDAGGAGHQEVVADDGFTGHRYEFIVTNDISTWEEGVKYCENLGGYMAVISSKEENDYLTKLFLEGGYEGAYFGYSDSAEEGTWKWNGPEESSFVNWEDNEPNDQDGIEDYAMFYDEFSEGKWNDGSFLKDAYKDAHVIICEWDK